MQTLVILLTVLLIVGLVGGLFAARGARGPWPGIGWFFLLLFIGTLAIGSWTRPIGPEPWGVPIINFLSVALLLALLVAALTPDYRHGHRRIQDRPTASESPPLDASTAQGQREAIGAAAAVGVLFWSFVIFAGILLLLQFFFVPP